MPEGSAPEPAKQVVLNVAKLALNDAKEITVLVGLIRQQNTGGVNKRLIDRGAGLAGVAVRNALIARLVILVARAYARSKHTDDRHLQVAVNLLGTASTRDHFSEGKNKEKLAEFDAQWTKCKSDERMSRIKLFRDKYTAHLAEPENIDEATYQELFEFGAETARAMELFALATGVAEKPFLTERELSVTTDIFWMPWRE